MNFKYIFGHLLLVFYSCSKEQVINVPYTKPKVVVNCIFNPDSNWQVSLSLSGKFTDTSFVKINNAMVFIVDDQANTINLTNTNNGNYTINSKPIAGKTYYLKVKVAGYDTIFAQDKIPNKNITVFDLSIDSLNKTTILIGNDKVELNEVLIKLQDTNTTSPIYRFDHIQKINNLNNTIYADYELLNGGLSTSDNTLKPLGKNLEFLISESKNFILPQTLQVFCVYNYTDRFGIGVDSILQLDQNTRIKIIPPVVLTTYIDITQLSKSNYLYQMALLKQKLSTGELFGSYQNSYTNIKNGLGIFAGQYTIRKKLY